MKKILLITSLLIVFGVGCSNNETEERIAMLEHRIGELETDLLCKDRNSGDALHSRFAVGRNYPKGFTAYCSARSRYLKGFSRYENLPLDRYQKSYYENKDTFQDLKWFEQPNNEERESIFEPVYKDWFAEKGGKNETTDSYNDDVFNCFLCI
jgi:uncharacterized small protein (DUF1192 family)